MVAVLAEGRASVTTIKRRAAARGQRRREEGIMGGSGDLHGIPGAGHAIASPGTVILPLDFA